MTYFDELSKAMAILSNNGYIFAGQACREKGTAMSDTLVNIPKENLVELPVFENTQMGISTGIAMAGGKVCSIYPRINFFLEAVPQLVQHLDKIPLFSEFRPKVIIRTAVATDNPLDPGPQHLGDYSDAIEKMLSTVKVVRLYESHTIVPAYINAMNEHRSTILIEYSDKMRR